MISIKNPAIFHPNFYNEAIERRGQYAKWKQALTCYCADNLNRADPGCPKCRGRGVIYFPVKELRTLEEGVSLGGSILNTKASIKTIEKLFNFRTKASIAYNSFSGNKIYLPSPLQKSIPYSILYLTNLEKEFIGSCVWEGNRLIRVLLPDLNISVNNKFIGEIIEVIYLRNITTGKSMNVIDFWNDMILTDSNYSTGDVMEISCKYVEPVRFLISNINFKKQSEAKDLGQRADMQMTVPSYHDIGDGDMISLITSTQRMSVVGSYTDDFKLPVFEADSIIRIEDSTKTIEGAVPIRNNQIQWGDIKPTGRFSISFTYHPTFLVNGDLSDPRSMEDKILPRKIILKRWGADSAGDFRPNLSTNIGS